MHPFIQSVFTGIREDFGYPASLVALLRSHPQIRVKPDAPATNICAESVTHWHELGKSSGDEHGYLRGWRTVEGYHLEGISIVRPEYSYMGRCEAAQNWTCDITDLHGFSASKSELRTFESTDQMVEKNSRDMISEISLEKLRANLAHREIRIIHSPGIDHFTRYKWDGRLWLMNSGGSHHTAAAKYIAARLKHPVPLSGTLYSYSLNASAVAGLCKDFRMFVINDEAEIHNAFVEAMRAFRATWLWHSMPRPYRKARAILLPRNERRSMRVAEELATAGMWDLGKHLTDLAASRAMSPL